MRVHSGYTVDIGVMAFADMSLLRAFSPPCPLARGSAAVVSFPTQYGHIGVSHWVGVSHGICFIPHFTLGRGRCVDNGLLPCHCQLLNIYGHERQAPMSDTPPPTTSDRNGDGGGAVEGHTSHQTSLSRRRAIVALSAVAVAVVLVLNAGGKSEGAPQAAHLTDIPSSSQTLLPSAQATQASPVSTSTTATTPPTPTPTGVVTTAGVGHTTASTQVVRSLPSMSGAAIGSINQNENETYDATSKGWFRLVAYDGWVDGTFFVDTPSPTVPSVRQSADTSTNTSTTTVTTPEVPSQQTSPAATETLPRIYVGSSGGQAQVDGGGAVLISDVSAYLGRPYVAEHSNDGGSSWYGWGTGQEVSMSGLVTGTYRVVSSTTIVRTGEAGEASKVTGLPGDVLLQTCLTDMGGGRTELLILSLDKVP